MLLLSKLQTAVELLGLEFCCKRHLPLETGVNYGVH